MDFIGVSCDWELHCRIAETNGITDFTGTAEQNTALLNLLKAGKLIIPGTSSSGTTEARDLIIGVNERYIGAGYEDRIATAFEIFMAQEGYSFSVEYRTLGNSSTTVAQLGSIINTAGDIDFVLGAGANIYTQGGVEIVNKALLLDQYNADGKRYGALLSDELAAVVFYNFVTGECCHIYDNDHDATCNACGDKRTIAATESLVIGVNERYIGEGYEEMVKTAFSDYLADAGYVFDIEYRTLGDSSTTVAELGSIINDAGDIDFVLGAGANIYTKGGVAILTKAHLSDKYNSDGKRYGALLTDKLSAVLLYNFVTGDCYHIFGKSDGSCSFCGAGSENSSGVAFEYGKNVSFISGYDSSAPALVITGGSAISFTSDSDGKDEAWKISLGEKKLDPNTSYSVTFSLRNTGGNVGVGCVRDEYLSGHHGINTFYGNFADPGYTSNSTHKIRVRRGFYEIEDILKGSRTTFPYANAYRDADGYVSLKMTVQFNGKTYVSTLYYLNKSSNWVSINKAYVGISSSNTFGLYLIHGSTSGTKAAIKNVQYTIEEATTSYSSDVTTPTVKLVDYNVQTGNSYYTKTANWLLCESPRHHRPAGGRPQLVQVPEEPAGRHLRLYRRSPFRHIQHQQRQRGQPYLLQEERVRSDRQRREVALEHPRCRGFPDLRIPVYPRHDLCGPLPQGYGHDLHLRQHPSGQFRQRQHPCEADADPDGSGGEAPELSHHPDG